MTLELDVASLLEPFEGGFRGGIDLREDDDPNNDYRRIRDARNEARDEERESDVSGESSVAATSLWREVWEGGLEYLKASAKDLEIVAYMIEASIRLDGYAGLAQSLSLTRELLQTFWGELLPTPDEDGVETTLRPIARLNGDVITYPLMRVRITEDKSISPLVVWQYDQALQLESLNPEERQKRIAQGAVTLETFNRAITESSDAFLRRTAADIRNALEAVRLLGETLEEKAGDADAPNLSKFQKALEDASRTLQLAAGERLKIPEPVEAATEGGGSATASGAEKVGGRGEISSRSDAFQVLEKVAAWFELHEPQSILPSEIRKAIRRGRMTPAELYAELITDSDVRRQIFKDVGIVVPEDQ